MKQTKLLKLFSGILIMSFITISCSDDPASSNEDPPELPMSQMVEPDVSYFQDNPPQNNDSNYAEAYYYGVGLGSFAFITQSYLGYFSPANSEDADFKDGKWIWEYSYSFDGQSVSVVLTAEDTGNFVDWEMLWSVDDGQGNSFDDYRIIEGSIAKDGSSGSWTFNTLSSDSGDEVPALITEWSSSGENNLETQIDFYGDSDGELVSRYTYSQDENEFMVTLSEESENNDYVVFWDDQAMTGYFQTESDPNTRQCWDSNYQDVVCATVGY